MQHPWTRERLEQILSPSSSVVHVEADVEQRPWSRLIRLRLSWDPPGAGPTHLIAKHVPLAPPDPAPADDLPSEVAYYVRDYASVSDAPIPQCYHYEVKKTEYTLLLEDKSPTHASGFETAPTEARARGVARALAVLHVPTLGAPAEGDQPERYLHRCRMGLSPAAGELSAERARLVTEILAWLPARLRASLASDERCVLHGDLSPGNVLYPRLSGDPCHPTREPEITNPSDRCPLIIDRQPLPFSMRVGAPGWDLASLMAQHWHPEERRQYQAAALDTYAKARAERGAPIDPDVLWAQYIDGIAITVANSVEWLVDPNKRVDRRDLWSMFFDRTLGAWADAEGKTW